MRRLTACALGVLLLFLSASSSRAAGKVTLDNLLRQMTDLALLAEFPDPPYVTRQFSSHDRASEQPGEDTWFANHDHGFLLYDGTLTDRTGYFKNAPMPGAAPDGFFAAGTKVGLARNVQPSGDYLWAYATAADGGPINGKIPQGYIPRDAITLDPQGHVLAEMDGPGCVVRIWSANPQYGGNLRIYLDGAADPEINANMEYLLSGKWQAQSGGKRWTAFPEPLAHERSRGFNLYFPISYARHCKITTDKPDLFYHIDYRTYPKGTDIETFSLTALAGMDKAVFAVVKGLRTLPAPDEDVKGTTQGPSRPQQVKSGASLPPVEIKGPQAINALYVTVSDARDEAEALRGLVLIATFDDETKPQVWCPLGDFFGSAPGVNPSGSLPCCVQRRGDGKDIALVSHWSMPFAKSAKIEIRNGSKQDLSVQLAAAVAPRPWTERSLHFHAKWRTQTMKSRPLRDWTYCDVKGQGVFVGDVLSLMNPVTAWWGEGDEKIYVDGERFPSWFGTGTEDYYGYAWSDPTPFQHAYHNQTRCDGPGARGHTSVNRFHILDAIPFTRSFKFDMEVWHLTPSVEVAYAATSYWYARPEATDDFKEVDAKVLQAIPEPPPLFHVAGALEGEKLEVLGTSDPFPLSPQDMMAFPDGKWSGGAQLWGRPERTGQYADLKLPVPADGKYQVLVYLTKARDYGVVQFHLDGKPVGRPFDGFEPVKVVPTDAIDLGIVGLKKGKATLRVEVVGTNPNSVGLRYMWGLDCVMLKPAP